MILMQDECRGLSIWLSTRMDSRYVLVYGLYLDTLV
jgi:hypothetical protein